jgi:hypothetical protein
MMMMMMMIVAASFLSRLFDTSSYWRMWQVRFWSWWMSSWGLS